jgi:hypothetical protein
MKFVVLHDDFYISDIPSLSECKVVSSPTDETLIYEAPESLRDKLKVLDEIGLIKEIKGEQNDITSVDDIIRLTESVELLQGGKAVLRVKLLGHELDFTENQILSSEAFRARLIRLRKFIYIPKGKWPELVRFWLSIAKEVSEISEEDELREDILTYLRRCSIYTDIGNAVGRGTLFYSENTPDVAYCLSSHLQELNGKMWSMRKIRWIMREYLAGPSEVKRVRKETKRFWLFLISKTGINLEEQLWHEEDRSMQELEAKHEGHEN